MLLVALPPFLRPFPLSLLTQAVIYAVFAMSLDVLLGFTGLPSLGHAATFGVAAYAVGILATGHGAGFWTCLGAGLLAALLVAAVFGLLAIRALGVYFLMITLALAMVVWGLAFRWVSLTQGDNGISGIERPSLFGAHASVADPRAYYYFALFVFAAVFALLFLAMRSPFGMSLRGVVVGSLIVGLLDNFGKALFPELSYFTLFAPMALILALKPTGLFGNA